MSPSIPLPSQFRQAPQSEALDKWMKDSRVRDVQGSALMLFHATDADFGTFEFSEDIGFHFGSLKCAQTRIDQAEMEDACIMPVFLNLKNPLRMPDLLTWSPRMVIKSLMDLNVITEEDADDNELVDREQVATWLSAAGYDGIVYANVTEGGGDSYIAMHSHQVKSALGNWGSFDPEDPSIDDGASRQRDLRIQRAHAALDFANSIELIKPSHSRCRLL